MESSGKIPLSYHICTPGKELLWPYGQFLLSSLIKISMDSEIYFLIHPLIYTEITFQAVKRVSYVVLKGFSIYTNLAKYTLLVLPVIINSYKKQEQPSSKDLFVLPANILFLVHNLLSSI